MKDLIFEIIQIILIVIAIVGITFCLFKCSIDEDKKEWNDGYCECGGHWIYEQAVGHAYRTSYLYRCDKCGKTLEVWTTSVTEVENNV